MATAATATTSTTPRWRRTWRLRRRHTTATADCPQGYIATDGSVRLDHVDQGAGTFEDVVVLASGVTPNGRGWTGTIRNDTAGQVQAKVNVVCMTDETTSGEATATPWS